MKQQYVIKLNKLGYYGNIPFKPLPRIEATVFPSMKSARKQLNKLNGRLMKNGNAIIERLA